MSGWVLDSSLSATVTVTDGTPPTPSKKWWALPIVGGAALLGMILTKKK